MENDDKRPKRTVKMKSRHEAVDLGEILHAENGNWRHCMS